MDHAVTKSTRCGQYVRRLALLALAISAMALAYTIGYSMGDSPHNGTAVFCVTVDPEEREPGNRVPLVSYDPRSDPCPSELVVCGYLTHEVRYLRDIEPSTFRSERCPFRR